MDSNDAFQKNRRTIYGLISPFLTAKDRATVMRVEKAAHEVVGNAPFPGSDVSVRDVSTQLRGFAPIGLHGTSTTDASSLYEGVKKVAEKERTFTKPQELGGQLGPGFYMTQGFGQGEKNAAKFYAKERAEKTGSQPEIMRAHVAGIQGLSGMESLGQDRDKTIPPEIRTGKKDKWWPKTNEAPEYLEPYRKTQHTFQHSKLGQQTITKESGADFVTADMGSRGPFGNPITEHYEGRRARQVKLNWHAFDDTETRRGAKVMLTPNNTDAPLPKSFLDAVSRRKRSNSL